MKKNILCLCLIFLLFSFNRVQERTITGTVTTTSDGSTLPGVNVVLKGTTIGTVTDENGKYSLSVPSKGGTLVFNFVGFISQEIKISSSDIVNVSMKEDVKQLSEIVVTGYSVQRHSLMGAVAGVQSGKRKKSKVVTDEIVFEEPAETEWNTEEYKGIEENIFRSAIKNPLSTFSIDVDAASYSNIRRFINNGSRPPKDAVRIEEMINYFDYDYAQPNDDHPFAVHTEISSAPWNPKHRLIHVGLQGKKIPVDNLPPSNLVFLLDVSGSMNDPNKLPLVKNSFKMLIDQLREQDYVAIVVYAGAAGVVLNPTSGENKNKIIEALDMLQAGGSTAGGEGIRLAYALAKEHFSPDKNNRVILATDGDFNVGESSDAAMERLIEEKRKDGIFLTVLGYGMGNYKDSKMETLADKGNGNYAYIDNISEARKVFVNEFGGTLFTIAKDVKLQVEFNPAKVQAYRLIGYENRVLKNEDFNNDKKDAGDLGSGHTVTALYEIIPIDVKSEFFDVDDLKYQTTTVNPTAKTSDELMTIKLRYKKPNEDVSKLIVHPLVDSNIDLKKTSENFRWSASVAAFGMLLRESEFINGFTYDQVIEMARNSRGRDEEGYRAEFIGMVKSTNLVTARK
jgi:Ca-activated chloride channel homolog